MLARLTLRLLACLTLRLLARLTFRLMLARLTLGLLACLILRLLARLTLRLMLARLALKQLLAHLTLRLMLAYLTLKATAGPSDFHLNLSFYWICFNHTEYMVNPMSWIMYYCARLRMGQNAHHGRFALVKRRFARWCEAKRLSFCICGSWEKKIGNVTSG